MTRRLAHDLEFDKLLDLVAAHARTGMGRDLVRGAPVYPDAEEALAACGLTMETESLLAEGGTLSLAGIDDALPLLEAAGPLSAEPADLLALLTLARRVASARKRLLAVPPELGRLAAIGSRLPDTSELVRWAAPRLGRDGRVPDDASPELQRLRGLLVRSRQALMVELEGLRREHGDAATDAPPTLRHGRYCLAVRASARGRLPGLVLDSSGSGATAFVEPFAVVELNNALADTVARERDEVRRILDELATAFQAVRGELADAARELAAVDAAQAKVLFGRRVGGIVVPPGRGDQLVLVGARHPLLDERLAALRAELFGESAERGGERAAVPLDFRLPPELRTLVVSGPNAGGKTVVLKTIGLMVLMAAHGIPLPAVEGTAVPHFDELWCHIGDEQDVAADLSTFSGAMAATARLLRSASRRCLVLYDEIGAGTDPLEGAALGCALLEELTGRGWLSVATTHLAAISLNATAAAGMGAAAMDYDETAQRPTYRLRLGRPGRSRGLEIAASMGVHDRVLERARELVGGQHLDLDRWLARLEALEAELSTERGALAGERHELECAVARLGLDRQRLEEERERLPQLLADERERLRRRAKEQLDRALATLAEATRERAPMGRRRQQQLREQALDVPLPEIGNGAAAAAVELGPGQAVRLSGLGAHGVIQELRGGQALVAVGSKRLWVERGELLPAADQGSAPLPRVVVATGEQPGDELMLLGMDAEEARREVEHYLDRAFAAGRKQVRLVHGHGTGTLRRVVAEVCREHPAVRSFAHAPAQRGGSGATEVVLEES